MDPDDDDDDVLQCSESSVRHCRSTETEVQQTLKHQLLDCDVFIIPDLTEPVHKCVCFVGECPQDVVDLPRDFGSMSFTDVADQQEHAKNHTSRTEQSDKHYN